MSDASPPTLPEIAEASADGSLRALYADIRRVTGLPIVNLIYRHLATQESVLEWAWSALRPHFVSGAIAAVADSLRARLPALVEDLLGDVSMRSGRMLDTTEALNVVRVYGEANSLNLVAITALLQARHGSSLSHAGHPQALAAPSAYRALPLLPDLHGLGSETIARILRLNALGDERNPVIVASLYRHLTLWPDVLASVEALLGSPGQPALLTAARQATVETVQALLEQQPLDMPPPFPPFTRHFKPMVTRFATITIPKMLPIGALLEHAWQPDSPPL